MSKKIYILLSVLGISFLVLGYYWFKKNNSSKKEDVNVSIQSINSKEQVPQVKIDFSQAVKNPVEEMPSVNPYEDVKNPFKESYINPFK